MRGKKGARGISMGCFLGGGKNFFFPFSCVGVRGGGVLYGAKLGVEEWKGH